jgi:uncharacterized membrane protein YkoI
LALAAAQAIAAAENQVGGKAVETGIEDENGTVAFEVEVLKDGQRQRCWAIHSRARSSIASARPTN